MKDYIDILRELRIDNDKTQQDIADYLGIRQHVYSRYENKTHKMNIEYLIKLCLFYKVSADYILQLPTNLEDRRKSTTDKI